MLLTGKCGVVLGVANERSLAWHIARAAHESGARLAFNYQSERLAGDVRALADTLPGSITHPCDVAFDAQLDRFFAEAGRAFDGRLDFLVHSIAYAAKEDLAGRFVDSSREGFRLALEISAYSLVAATRRALPLMRAAGGGAVLTLTYFGAEKVIKNYNVMGVAKAALEAAVRYLAADLGPEAVRVNAISAGPVRTLASRGISRFGDMLAHAAERSPLGRSIEPGEVAQAALFLLGDGARGITGEILHVDAGFNIMGV